MNAPPRHFSPSAPLRIGWALFAGLILLFGLWGTQARLNSALTVQGSLHTSSPVHELRHMRSGKVDEINVKNGALVQEGDILFRLNTAEAEIELAGVVNALHDLSMRQARLRAEFRERRHLRLEKLTKLGATLHAEQSLLTQRWTSRDAQLAHFEQDLAAAKSELQGLDAQRSALTQEISLLHKELDRHEKLHRGGLVAGVKVTDLKREKARLHGRLSHIDTQRTAAQNRAKSVALQKAHFLSQWRETALAQLRESAKQHEELTTRAASLRHTIARATVRAPKSGRIHNTQLHASGDTVQAGQILMQIIPEQAPSRAIVRIAPHQIDQVFVGQRAALTISSQDAQASAPAQAQITHISEGAIDVEGQNPTAYFEAQLELSEDSTAFTSSRLRPGMQIEAHLYTARLSPMAFILAPFTRYLSHRFQNEYPPPRSSAQRGD